MERAIWISWRVFWVGLGASLVLVVQALATSPTEDPKPSEPAIIVPAPTAPPAAAAKWKSADPKLSRVHVKRGPLG